MKVPIVAILMCGIALGAVLTFPADSGTTPDNSEIDTLRKQVQALETRVEMLEKLLAQQQQDPNAVTVPPFLHGRPVPENWSRREFNGMPYYVIPLRYDPNRTVPLRK